MSEKTPSTPAGRAEPIVAAYRERILYALAVIATVVLLPFSIGNFVQGYLLIGAVSMAVVLIFVADAAAIYLRRRLPVPIPVAFVVIMVALVIAIWGRGLLGIFWTFPAILLFHFVLERRLANLFNLTLVALVGGVAFYTLATDVALRIVAGQLLTIVFTNIFSYVVEAEQRKETEQRRRLGLLVRATNAGFFQWERASDERVYSGRLKEMLGHPPDADTSAWPPLPEFMHPEDRERRVTLFQAGARQGGRPGAQRLATGGDFRLRHANGEYVWVHAQGLFIHGEDGRVARYIASLVDVSERYRQQEDLRRSHNQIEVQAQQLRDQNAALRDAIRVREEVERIARHDLKTPLNSILAALRQLREKRKPDERESELLGMVDGAAYRVLDLVNLSVDIHRMEQGAYRFSPRVVDLTVLAETVARDVRAHADTKGVRIEMHVGGEPAGIERRAYAWAEEMLCYSVIANLLKNAVEASPDGGTVRIDFDPAGAQVALRMRNDGVVPASVRRAFFEKYATYGKVGGSGLGTYSARLMARVQQGELSMHTSETEGTLLELRLPALPEGVAPGLQGKHGAAIPTATADARPLPALRVLLVDDDEFNVAFVRGGLPSPPLEVITAINGRAAVAAARESAPDVVFMDLEMPVMNGFEAIGRIRALESADGRKPSKVIAFSSYDDDAIRRRCVEAGFDAYLSKPAPRERIHDILRAVAEGRALPEQARPQRQRPGGPDDPVDVDPDMLGALPRFVETRGVLLEELRGALLADKREAVLRLAHKLAGSLALYRFDWAAQESRAIQQAAASGGDLASLAGRCEALRRHLATFTLRDRGDDGRAPQAAAGR
jgi:signal transduction histidine kinase/DNA-binding NarL/FixJ family response regulator